MSPSEIQVMGFLLTGVWAITTTVLAAYFNRKAASEAYQRQIAERDRDFFRGQYAALDIKLERLDGKIDDLQRQVNDLTTANDGWAQANREQMGSHHGQGRSRSREE